MDTHVRVLAVLHIVLGAFGLVAAFILMIIFGGAAGIAGASGDPDAELAMPIIGLTGLALVVVVGALSLPGIIVGFGLLKFRSWARIFAIVLSILDLIWIPFGTVVGAYGLWVLLSRDTERLFDRSLTTPP
ncbi:MAG TPA: hypothetical protein VH702_05125 [Vicinamibacterales bacterium]|jgi:hypothetical protein